VLDEASTRSVCSSVAHANDPKLDKREGEDHEQDGRRSTARHRTIFDLGLARTVVEGGLVGHTFAHGSSLKSIAVTPAKWSNFAQLGAHFPRMPFAISPNSFYGW